jgi:hypothetical protein
MRVGNSPLLGRPAFAYTATSIARALTSHTLYLSRHFTMALCASCAQAKRCWFNCLKLFRAFELAHIYDMCFYPETQQT